MDFEHCMKDYKKAQEDFHFSKSNEQPELLQV